MSARFNNPFPQFMNSASALYAGGSLTFYITNTTTPLDTYTDSALSVANANPVVLNSAGYPSTAIFLQNRRYTVVLKDSSGNEIWTADNVSASDFASFSIRKVGSGSPNGVVEGTAASSGVLPTEYWDFLNSILYICTTTGSAATAAWTAVNASAATATVVPPQGYLTPTSGLPVILTDVSAGTAVYYTPDRGNLIPIYNGARYIPTEFSELTLTLSSSHVANSIYDVWGFANSGVTTLATGPAWSNVTAGSCTRGSGAGTTALTMLNGYLANAVSMTGRNGATTYTIGANLGTYLGSIFIDGSAGQITCHRSVGQSRKWGIWNAYNRRPLYLKVTDPNAPWNYTTNTIRASRNDATNSLTVFQGLAEEFYDLRFEQEINALNSTGGGTACIGDNGIGWNSTTAASGRSGKVGISEGGPATQSVAYGIGVRIIPSGARARHQRRDGLRNRARHDGNRNVVRRRGRHGSVCQVDGLEAGGVRLTRRNAAMAETRFEAQTVAETGRRQDTQSIELTFENADGARLAVSLPARVAADMLAPVLAQLSSVLPRPPGAPEFDQNVTGWRVGHSNEAPRVVFGLNADPLYSMSLSDAKKFWREIRASADIVDRRAPPTRQ